MLAQFPIEPLEAAVFNGQNLGLGFFAPTIIKESLDFCPFPWPLKNDLKSTMSKSKLH